MGMNESKVVSICHHEMIELLPEQGRTRWFPGPTGGGDLNKYLTQESRLSGESVWLRKVVGKWLRKVVGKCKCKCTQKGTFHVLCSPSRTNPRPCGR
jgi:hypothetical protein